MADSTLAALAAASALSGPELFYSVQSAADAKVTATQMKTFASASPTLVTPNIGVASGSSLQLGTVSVASGSLALANAGSAFLTTIQAGAAAAARTYTWPTDFGAAGTVLTDAAGNGTLSWGAGGGGVTNPLTLTRLLTVTQGTANEGIFASTGYSLTGANAQNMVDLAGTWNTSGNPVALKIAMTVTASGATSKFVSFLGGAAGTTEFFNVDKSGSINAGQGANALITSYWAGGVACFVGPGTTFQLNAINVFGWVNNNLASTGTFDLKLSRKTTATLQFGAADAAAPVAQTMGPQSVVAGTSNTAGANWNITGSLSTGSGIAGKIIFNLSQIVAAATVQNASSPVLSLNTIAASGIQFNSYGAGALSTDASGNITATSDERLKHIEGRFDAGLAELMGIEPILYKWTAASGMETEHIYAGLGAANVREAVPEAVGVSGDGYLTLSDRALLATCINAIKQLASEVRR